jgi:pimeloyl-ACP methyl ester carboxylesterase
MQDEPDWFAPHNKQLIRVSDGESLAVWDQGGSGIPVLFLHGFPENHRCWGRTLSKLTASMTQLRCITYDLRGHGESSKLGEASWQRFFQDHIDLVAALGIDRYHLVGHDWGGAIGLHVSRFHPESLLSLVVLNTNYWKTDVGGMWHMLLLNVPIVAPLCFRWAPERMFKAFIINSLVDPSHADPSVLDSYRAAFEDKPTAHYWIRLYKNMAKGLIRQALPGAFKSKITTSAIKLPRSPDNAFQTPTTLVWGELDTFNPVPVGKAIEDGLKRYGAAVRFELVANAKHFVQEDQPEQVGEHIADHLRGFEQQDSL